jgi:hypothetical protein
MLLRFGIIKAVVLLTRERQAEKRFTKLGILRSARFESEVTKHPVRCRKQHMRPRTTTEGAFWM